jgi:TP901 family phage tail tape measure protein
VSVVANIAVNVDSRNAVSKLKQVQQGAQATSQAVDKLNATTAATSDKFKIAANGIKYFTDAAGRARAENGRFLTTAERAAAGIRNQGNAAQQASGQFNLLKNAFSGLAAAFGAGFALTKVIADVKELDTNLRRLGTVGGNVAALDKGLGALSDRLDGVANKAELAAASYQALSAGFTETGANLRVVEAATKAAVGGLADITGVVDVTTKVLNSYNMSGDQATKVTDSISKAVELGQVQWSDYTSQLGRVASIAAIAGVSLDEVNAFVAAATKNGATAEVAFTGLGASLATIIKPTKESAKAAQSLGINWTLAGLRGEGFESLMNQLAKAMESNTEKATEMVGGQEAVRGAFAAASKGGKDYAMILEGLGGAADKTDADFQTMKGSLENTLKALDTSFKNLSEVLGAAFGPTVVIAVQDITKAVNGFADFMATVPQPVMNTAGELVKLVAQILLLDKALKIAIATAALFRGAMLLLTTQTTLAGAAALTGQARLLMLSGGIKGAGVAAATATPALAGLLGVLLRLAAIGAIAIVINVAVTGMAAVYQAQAEISKLRGIRAEGGPKSFGGSATAEQKKVQQGVIASIQKERATPKTAMDKAAAAFGIGKTFARQRTDQLTEREANARAILALPTRKGATPAPNAMGTPVGATVGGASTGRGGGASNAANDAKRAADEAQREAQRVADVVRDQEFITKQKGIQTKFAQLIFEAEQAADPVRARQLQTVEALVLAGNETARLLEEETNRTAQLAIARTRQGEAEAIRQEGMLAVLDLQLQQQKNFDEIIAGLDLELALKTATTEQAREQLRLEAEIAKLKGQGFTPEQIGTIAGKKTELAKPKEESQKIEERLGKVKDELKELTSLSYQVTKGAEAIGGAFQQAFMGLVSGSMTAKEALASFFKSVADHFLDMASQMIAKMIEMFILQTILGIIGGAAGGGGGGGGNYSSAFKSAPKTSFGGALAMPKLMAEGGFVTGPTSAVIGEGGESEYVIPASKMQSAMSRYSRGARGEGVIAGSGGGTEGGTATAAAGPMVVDVRYTVERINDVEYVTASQFQAGMRQAAQQGAAQGEQRTLRRLQQSPGTRKRVGM